MEKDDFIKKMMVRQGIEKAPEDFTQKVMLKVKAAGPVKEPPLLSPGGWLAIVLAVAAFITMIFVVDLPFLDSMFSSTGIRQFTAGFFSGDRVQAFFGIIRGFSLNQISLIILVAAACLVVIERLISRKFFEANLLMI